MTLSELFRLDGKVAVVTGASSGLGVSFAAALAEAGADLVLGARRVDRLQHTKEIVERLGRRAVVVETDVTRDSDCVALVEEGVDAFGGVHILVNNAGLGTAVPALRETEAEFREVIDVNLIGCYAMAHAFASRVEPRGSIVNVGSVIGLTTAGLPQAAYSSTKAALVGLTRDLAAQLAKERETRVNCLAPGFFPSEMTAVFSAEYLDEVTNRTLLGRLGNERELAATLVWLVSDAAGYVTGQTIVVDGGFSCS